MQLPSMTEFGTSQDVSDVFAGYNHNMKIGDGEFYDMQNLTSEYYPILSPRCRRGTYATPSNPQGLIAKDGLCYVDGSKFVINNETIDMGLSTDASDCPKTLVSMGAYVVILPDRKYINTANLTDYGNIDAETTVAAGTATSFELCKIDGTAYDIPAGNISASEPESPNDRDYWIDTSSVPHTLKQYSKVNAMWVSIPTTYIKIQSTDLGKAFSQYDGITISGLKGATLSDYDSGDTFEDSDISDIDGNFVIWEKGDNYIVIIGKLDHARKISNSITVSRKMPKMDFVIESQNRLWGCRYGESENGDVVNEIYCSKLGDFKNWNCFMGLSTDSYRASCGTDGQWTGAVTYLGYPTFFKENCLHKVYGNYPANYQIQDTACRGVQKGSEKSLAMVNEVLYYKSRLGVCAYDGSLPAEISAPLGNIQYSNAIACAHGNKYYISMMDANNVYSLFVYDAANRMWFKEDSSKADAFCSCRSELYYIADGKIKTIGGSGAQDAAPVEWMAETGIIGTYLTNKKYISKMTVRMSLDTGSKADFYIQYDSMGQWEHVSAMSASSLRSFNVPIRPKRCDHFRLRIVGRGDAKIYSIAKTIEQGSDMP